MEQKKKKNTAAVVREIVEPIVTGLGYMLWDVEYVKEGAEMVLRITIDKEDGIGIDDCEKVHRAIDPAGALSSRPRGPAPPFTSVCNETTAACSRMPHTKPNRQGAQCSS